MRIEIIAVIKLSAKSFLNYLYVHCKNRTPLIVKGHGFLAVNEILFAAEELIKEKTIPKRPDGFELKWIFLQMKRDYVLPDDAIIKLNSKQI